MKLVVTFSRRRGREPVIAQVVLDTGVLINVERAQIDSQEGEALIEVPDESCELVRQRLEDLGASVHQLDRTILYNREECVDCGSCISICPQDVFAFDDEWQVIVHSERCVLCGKCEAACPHGALTLQALMLRERFHYRETHATLLAEEEAHLAAAREAIVAARSEVERVGARDPFFLSALEPYDPGPAGRTVRRMVEAAGEAGVGPMAAVAGVIAASGVEAMVAAGARFAVVENGGDIAYAADRPLRVGVHAGCSPYSDRYAFVLPAGGGVRGCCTSSATVGPSVSFGVADAVTVFADDPAVADAWATRLCNDLRPGETSAFGLLGGSRVAGACAVFGERVARWGSVPRVVRARVDPALITAADST